MGDVLEMAIAAVGRLRQTQATFLVTPSRQLPMPDCSLTRGRVSDVDCREHL